MGPSLGPAGRWLCALAAGVLLAAGVAALDGDTGLRAWWRTTRELASARAANLERAEHNEALARERDALEHEPFALERAIREDLGLARPGERVVRFGRPAP